MEKMTTPATRLVRKSTVVTTWVSTCTLHQTGDSCFLGIATLIKCYLVHSAPDRSQLFSRYTVAILIECYHVGVHVHSAPYRRQLFSIGLTTD